MVKRQHRHRRREPDTLRARRDMSEHQVRTREHAETAEVMLADPGGIHSYLFGVDRFVEDVGDDLIGAAPIILVVVIAQREVAEFHFFWVPIGMNSQRAIRDLNSCLDISSERIKPPPQGLKQHVGLFLAMRYKEMKLRRPLRGACRW